MRARDDQKKLNTRINLLTWANVIVFFFLAGAFWYVQALQADRYRNMAESNALREINVPAKRGLIMDRHGKILVDNRPAYQLNLMRSDIRAIERADPGYRSRLLQFVAQTLDITLQELEERVERRKTIPFNQPLPLADNLTLAQVAELEAHRLAYPGIYIEPVQRRNYRYGTFAAHVLGYIGEANEKEMAANPELKLGDLIGKGGMEFMYDDYLRGRDGARYMVVNTHGRMLQEYPGANREPVAGQDIYLTIDFDLQRRAEQYFIENEMVGAAVALDPQTGEVLAMVSSPAFDPNVYSGRFTPETWRIITSNPFRLEMNRATQGMYSPGSVFKIVDAMAALYHGLITPSTTFNCGGSAAFHGRVFRCWRPQGHGTISLARAIQVSCNIYFYNVGSRLGLQRIHDFSRQLTLGEITRIDLPDEKAGLVPSEQWAREKQNRKWYPSETISVAIGQGPLVVTPLQVANMMAAIATAGKVHRPHLLKVVERPGPNGEVQRLEVQPEVVHDTPLDPRDLQQLKHGLWTVVNEPGGTARASQVDGLDVSGKTGTAQVIAPGAFVKSANLPYAVRAHGWFASFAPRDEPELVVVVFVEHAGGGGAFAAPLAGQMFQTYFRDRLTEQRLDLSDPETLQRLKKGELPTAGQPARR
jgi:penicillin-binding protein 2